MRPVRVARGIRSILVGVLVLGASMTPSAQTANPPPVTGTIALEGTMKTLYRAANTIVVATIDGVEHVYHFAKDLVVHGGKGIDPLQGLREGVTVVVHYTLDGTEPSVREIDVVDDEGLRITEGVVTNIDGGRKRITIRYDSGKTETFLLTDRAAAEAAADIALRGAGATTVVIYYVDDGGRKVAHFFKKI